MTVQVLYRPRRGRLPRSERAVLATLPAVPAARNAADLNFLGLALPAPKPGWGSSPPGRSPA